MTADKLAEVERLCREAITEAERRGYPVRTGDARCHGSVSLLKTFCMDADGVLVKAACMALGLTADDIETLHAAFSGQGQDRRDDPDLYALGAKLRAECVAKE